MVVKVKERKGKVLKQNIILIRKDRRTPYQVLLPFLSVNQCQTFNIFLKFTQ